MFDDADVIHSYGPLQAIEDGMLMPILPLRPKFPPGLMVITPGAQDVLRGSGVFPTELLSRHLSGDWGDGSKSDQQMNDRALRNKDDRLFSVYTEGLPGTIYVITDDVVEPGQMTVTTILTPSEY